MKRFGQAATILAICFFSICVGAIPCYPLEATKLDDGGASARFLKNRSGAFVGSTHGILVTAGGTVDGQRDDAIFFIEKKDNKSFQPRISDAKLPEETAHGVAISTDRGLFLIGGEASEGKDRPSDRCFALVWNKIQKDFDVVEYPQLPVPILGATGDVLNNVLYLAGTDESGGPLFLKLELAPEGGDATKRAWEKLPPYPGEGRQKTASVIQNIPTGKAFFLFGGHSPPSSEASSRPLSDAYAFDLQKNEWMPVKNENDLPFNFTSVVASGTIHLIFPEKEGANEKSAEIWAFNTITNKLFLLGSLPRGTVTGGLATFWNGHVTLPLFNESNQTREIFTLTLEEKTNRLSRLNQGIIAAYFVFLAAVSIYFLRKMKGTDDYFRGGCRVPWWALGISIYGTITSAITYITVPAKSFMTDWSYILLAIGPFLAVPLLIWFYIPKISRFNFTSAYEYLEYRFNFFVRILGSVIFIIFQIMRIAILLFLPSIALNAITGIDIRSCILGVGIAGVFCTLLGGIEIIIWIEVFQVLILLIGFVLALIAAVVRFDGTLLDMLKIGLADGKFHCADLNFNFHLPTLYVVLIASFFLYIIPYASDQTILQRYFAGKDNATRSRGVWISLALMVPNLLLLFLAGTLFYVFYKENPRELLVTMSNNDSLMPWFFVSQLPNGLSGFLLLALFTSAMSSVSSGINAISATYTIDFHERIFHFSRDKALGTARVVTLVSGTCGILFALAMATWDIASLWDQYNLFIGLVSSGLAGIFFLGVFCKRANTPGALIGLAVSCVVQFAVAKFGLVHLLLYSGTGLVTTIVVGRLASSFFPAKILKDPTVPSAPHNV